MELHYSYKVCFSGYMNATKSMIKAMMSTPSCRRLILVHSWYTRPDTRKNAQFFIRCVIPLLFGPTLDGMEMAEKYLREDSEAKDIVWTTVLPPSLSNGPVTGIHHWSMFKILNVTLTEENRS